MFNKYNNETSREKKKEKKSNQQSYLHILQRRNKIYQDGAAEGFPSTTKTCTVGSSRTVDRKILW